MIRVNLSDIFFRYSQSMTSRVPSVNEAYAIFGLRAEDGLTAAKRKFRDLVKTLHPDVTPATPETLSRLANAVAAMRQLEQVIPACMDLEISARQARDGITRTLRAGNKRVLVRIPAGTKNGDIVNIVGEENAAVMIHVLAATAAELAPCDPLDFGPLDDFIDEFSRPSANTRFAGWIRKAQSTA
jgi:hypothetical protein